MSSSTNWAMFCCTVKVPLPTATQQETCITHHSTPELHADLRPTCVQRLARLEQEGHTVPARIVDVQRDGCKRGAQRVLGHCGVVQVAGQVAPHILTGLPAHTQKKQCTWCFNHSPNEMDFQYVLSTISRPTRSIWYHIVLDLSNDVYHGYHAGLTCHARIR